MTEETTATPATGLVDGFTPLNPPTHLRVDFTLPGTDVAGHVVLEVDDNTELDDLWLSKPGFNYAADYEHGDQYVLPFTYDVAEEGFISEEMAADLFDAVQVAAVAANVSFEWDYLTTEDVYTMAWLRNDMSVQLDHAYGDEHTLRVGDARIGATWLWGGADLDG